MSTNKSPPFGSLGLYASAFRCLDKMTPRKVTYPYLMVLAEYDHYVNNKASKAWHAETQSKVK